MRAVDVQVSRPVPPNRKDDNEGASEKPQWTVGEALPPAPTSLLAGVKTMVRFSPNELWVGGKEGTVACYQRSSSGEIKERRQYSVAIHDAVTSLCWVTLPGTSGRGGHKGGASAYGNCRLWCGCQNGRILVLNVELGKVEHNFIAHGATIQAMFQAENVAMESGPTTVVWSTSTDWSTKLYDAGSQRMLKKITKYNHWLRSMTFVTSTGIVWNSSTDKSISFWKTNGEQHQVCDVLERPCTVGGGGGTF